MCILFFHFEIINAFYVVLISNYRLYPRMFLIGLYAKISITNTIQILLIQVQMSFGSKSGMLYVENSEVYIFVIQLIRFVH